MKKLIIIALLTLIIALSASCTTAHGYLIHNSKVYHYVAYYEVCGYTVYTLENGERLTVKEKE